MTTRRYKRHTSNYEFNRGGGVTAKDIADWLSKYQWTLYFTLTFRDAIYDHITAMRRFEKWFYEWLAKNVPHTEFEQDGIYWSGLSHFIASETFSTWRGVHIHGVIAINTAELINIDEIQRSWESWYGIAEIEFYDKEKNGVEYISKFCTNERNWWTFDMPKADIQNAAILESARLRHLKETAARFREFGIIPSVIQGAGT